MSKEKYTKHRRSGWWEEISHQRNNRGLSSPAPSNGGFSHSTSRRFVAQPAHSIITAADKVELSCSSQR